MTTILTAYIGRDNEERLELLQDGVLVTASAVTRAVLKFGSFCLDTDVDTDEFYFLDSNNQVLCLKIGLLTGLAAKNYFDGKLTLFDNSNPEGLAWTNIHITVFNWNICSI